MAHMDTTAMQSVVQTIEQHVVAAEQHAQSGGSVEEAMKATLISQRMLLDLSKLMMQSMQAVGSAVSGGRSAVGKRPIAESKAVQSLKKVYGF